MTTVDEWLLGAGPTLGIYAETRNPVGGDPIVTRFANGEHAWSYLPAGATLTELYSGFVPESARLSLVGALVVDLLGQPGELTLERRPGGALVRHSEQAISSMRYRAAVLNPSLVEPYLFDLRPITMTTELELGPAGEALAARVYAEGLDGARVIRTLVLSYELVTRETVFPDEAPAPVRDGAPPAGLFAQPFASGPLALATLVRYDKIAQAVGWPGVPIYAFADDAATLLAVEEGAVAQQGENLDYSAAGGVLREAVARRLALRLTYRAPADAQSSALFDIIITQGPAAELRSFLRSSPMVPWSASQPIRLTIGGREVDGWYGVGAQKYLIVELGDSLLVIETTRPPDDPQLLALLAGIAPARE
jgi:hypothetical protein